ncbi:MAG: MFS transporter [Pseudomonadota bacterium]
MQDDGRASRPLFGLPRGAVLVIFVEFWERFSFYGMLAILVLFLRDDPSNGGFGWDAADALTLVGTYSACMYGLPWLGGIIADRFIGFRNAILVGLVLMTAGHLLMAVPHLIIAATAGPVGDALLAGAPIGELLPTDTTVLALGPGAVSVSLVVGLTFYGALLCLVVGNMLMKSPLIVLMGELFDEADPKREAAFSYYYLSISVGSLFAGLVIGTLAQSAGWDAGFALAGLGMATALLSYLMLGPRMLGNAGRGDRVRPASPVGESQADIASGANPYAGLIPVFTLGIFLTLFEIGWFQLYGSWALVIEEQLDRAVAGFTVPTPWFQSVNAAVVIAITPIAAMLFVRLARRGRNVGVIEKYAAALFFCAISQFLMAWVAAGGGTAAALVVVVLAIILVSLGELLAWPSTYGMVYSAAPAAWVASVMGAWYLLTLLFPC